MSGTQEAPEALMVTVREAARMLSVSTWQVYDLAAAGSLERRYIGNGKHYFRIPVESLRKYVESLPTDPVEDAL